MKDNRKFKKGEFVRFITLEGVEEFGTIGGIVHMPDMDIYHVDGFYTINVERKGGKKTKDSGGLVWRTPDYQEGFGEIPEENIRHYNEWIRESKIDKILKDA